MHVDISLHIQHPTFFSTFTFNYIIIYWSGVFEDKYLHKTKAWVCYQNRYIDLQRDYRRIVILFSFVMSIIKLSTSTSFARFLSDRGRRVVPLSTPQWEHRYCDVPHMAMLSAINKVASPPPFFVSEFDISGFPHFIQECCEDEATVELNWNSFSMDDEVISRLSTFRFVSFNTLEDTSPTDKAETIKINSKSGCFVKQCFYYYQG